MLSTFIIYFLASLRYIQSLQGLRGLRERFLLSLPAQENSGIYQYQGKSPPPELAKLFGVKANEGKRKPNRKTNNNNLVDKTNIQPKKKSKIQPTESVDNLEKDLILKYRSSAYKDIIDDEDWEEEEEPKASSTPARKFEGFQRVASNSPRDKEAMDREEEKFYRGLRTLTKPSGNSKQFSKEENEEFQEQESQSSRQSLLLGRLLKTRSSTASAKAEPTATEEVFDYEGFDREEMEEEEDLTYEPMVAIKAHDSQRRRDAVDNAERAGPLNALNGYRLRKPVPLTAAQQANIDASVAAQAAREAAALERKKAKRQAEDSKFSQFDFDKVAFPVDTDDIFTTLRFEDIGVKNKIVLRNLERMRMYNPTKIQELSIPLLSDGRNVVMQAQTGSGKTLAFLYAYDDVIISK